jgi:sarcosine oxidase, subunit beta
MRSLESMGSALREPVVVIGAGIVGVSAAYHLLTAGARNVTVIDRVEPGEGTTKAGAGFVAKWNEANYDFGPGGLQLQDYALQFYRGLHAEGARIGFRANGNLVLALKEETWREVVRPIATRPGVTPGTRALDPDEVGQLTGVVDPVAVAGGVLMPAGIQIAALRAVRAVAERVRNLGGNFKLGTPVSSIVSSAESVTAVVTADGQVIPARHLVIAAGAWTNRVLESLGVQLPLFRMLATRIVTEPAGVPASMPTIQCGDLGLWIREREGAFTWGTVHGYRPAYGVERQYGTAPDKMPRDESLYQRLVEDQPAIERVFPRLRDTKIISWLQGMPVYTPDHRFTLGPLGSYRNVVVVAGDNEAGVTHGPALGKVAADLTVNGSTDFDIDAYDPMRFDGPTDESAIGALIGEIYQAATPA